MKTSTFLFLAILSLLLLLGPTGVLTNTLSAPLVDNGIYAELLKKYVKNGVVDYQGFKKGVLLTNN